MKLGDSRLSIMRSVTTHKSSRPCHGRHWGANPEQRKAKRNMRNRVTAALAAGAMALLGAVAFTPTAAAHDATVVVDQAAAAAGGARSSGKPARADMAESTEALSVTFYRVPADGRVNCHGYIGTFKVGSDVMVVDWDTTGVECFGVAPNRTIWHTWAGTGGWKTMPGNGRADDTWGAWENASTGARGVEVYVASGPSIWCQGYSRSGGWAGRWYQC